MELGESTLTGFDSLPQHITAMHVTRGILTTLGVQPILGRWFSPEDDRPGTPETVILGGGY